MKLVKISENFAQWISEKPSRDHSFIADIDLADHAPEFWAKCDLVLSSDLYGYQQKEFVNNVLEFYDDWSYVTWKQYDSVMNIWETRKYIQLEQKNREYLYMRLAAKAKAACSEIGNLYKSRMFTGNALDYALEQVDEETLMGRFLPTDEAMDNLWNNVCVAAMGGTGPLGRKFGFY